MATARQLPSGNWRVRACCTDLGGVKRVESFTAETKRRAEALALAWQEGMIQRRKSAARRTLGEAMDAYVESCRCAGLSPATTRAYLSARANAYPSLIDRPVDRIALPDVQAWINTRSAAVSPKTVKNNLALLSAVLKAEEIALDLGALKRPKMHSSEMQIHSDAQVAAMLRAAYDDDDLYLSVAFAALMGLRRSEICALRWSDITTNGDAASLHVSRAVVMDEDALLVEKDTKTRSGSRSLPIPAALCDELKRRRSLRPAIISAKPNAVTTRYARLAKRTGAPTRFHSLRHYHASVMLREGVPEPYIVADMGHASFDMVRRVYGHVMGEKQAEIHLAMAAHAAAVLHAEGGRFYA